MQLSIRYTLWLFNRAMENDPFIDDVPIKIVIFHGYVKSSIRDGTFTHESSISNGGLPAHYQFLAAKLLDVLLLHMPLRWVMAHGSSCYGFVTRTQGHDAVLENITQKHPGPLITPWVFPIPKKTHVEFF